jgi:hypothetical protein
MWTKLSYVCGKWCIALGFACQMATCKWEEMPNKHQIFCCCIVESGVLSSNDLYNFLVAILHIVKDVVMWSIISSICPVIHLFSHENCFKLHIVKDVEMRSIISSICLIIHLFSHENYFKWWAVMWPFDYWVMFSGGHVYSIFIPWSYLKSYPKIKASWEDTREKIS